MRSFVAAAFLTGLLCVQMAGHATMIIYSQNFDDTAFKGPVFYSDYGPGGPTMDTQSEAWSPTYYYQIKNADGWTFQLGSEYTTNGTGTDGAVLLNELGGFQGSGSASNTAPLATTTLTGLTPGQQYSVSFIYWGDNNPGKSYELTGYIGSSKMFDVTGSDGAAGSNPNGNKGSFNFTAAGTSAVLGFGQVDVGPGSPIVDNVVVSVPEPASAALSMIAAAIVLGTRSRRAGSKAESK